MRNGEGYKDPTAGKAMRRVRSAREARLEEMDSLRPKQATMETVSEADEQEAVIAWADINQRKYPCLRRLLHIPNGGTRNVAEAVHLKRLGVKPGVPDLLLPYPSNGYSSLWIEMKSAKGRPSALQKEWIDWLNENGHMAVVCYGAGEAINALEQYVRQKPDINHG